LRNFKRLKVWTRAHDLTLDVYRATAAMPRTEQYGLTSQMRRAAMSITSNIAEGCGRSTDADFARFLHLAAGSANELESQLLLARELGYLDRDNADRLSQGRREVKKMLTALICSLDRRSRPSA
jgi:four helix bundle protein